MTTCLNLPPADPRAARPGTSATHRVRLGVMPRLHLPDAQVRSFRPISRGALLGLTAVVLAGCGGLGPAHVSPTGTSPATSPSSSPTGLVATGSGNGQYHWSVPTATSCQTGSGRMAWTADRAGASAYSVGGAVFLRFAVTATFGDQSSVRPAILTLLPTGKDVLSVQAPIQSIGQSQSCESGAGATSLGEDVLVNGIAGDATAAAPSKLKCKLPRPSASPSATPSSQPSQPTAFPCSLAAGSTLRWSGGLTRSSAFGSAEASWTLAIKRGSARTPAPTASPASPAVSAPATALTLSGLLNGALSAPGRCQAQAPVFQLILFGPVNAQQVVVAVRLGTYGGPGTFSVGSPPNGVATLEMSGGVETGQGTVTVGASGISGSLHLTFTGAGGTTAVAGKWGCLAT